MLSLSKSPALMTISIRSGSALPKTGLVVAGYAGQVVAHPLVAEIR